MKIAVPCENGQVVLHLASAKEFKIYDVIDDEILSEELCPIHEDNSTDPSAPTDLLIRLLTAQGVHVLICGLLPVSAMIALQKARIQVLGGAAGAADDRVNDFLTGTLHFDRGGSCASCAGSCSLHKDISGSGCSAEESEPECDGNVSACGHACF